MKFWIEKFRTENSDITSDAEKYDAHLPLNYSLPLD